MKCEYCGRVLAPGTMQCPGCGAAIEHTEEKQQQKTQFNEQENNVPPVYSGPSYTNAQTMGQNGYVEYAGFWKRVGAILIDYIVVSCICATYIGIPFAFVYMPICEAFWDGATVGKKALGIKVVNYNYDKISVGQAFGRYFAKFLSYAICCIGYFMAGFTEKKQALHDRMAATYVICKR